MSISQLDDPSMRSALGIEDGDSPSQLTSPVTIGSVGLVDGGSGLLIINNPAFPCGLRIGIDPVTTGISQLSKSSLSFTQINTGTTTVAVDFDAAQGLVTLNDVTALNGAGAGAALTNIATINGEPVGNRAYAVTSAIVGPLGPYPTQMFRAVIPHNIPTGRSALLTVVLNALVTPNPVGVGTDTLGISVRQQTGNVPTPNTLFTVYPAQIDTDLAGAQQPIVLTAQTIIVSDGGTAWTVAVNVLASTTGTTYTVTGGLSGMATLTELS